MKRAPILLACTLIAMMVVPAIGQRKASAPTVAQSTPRDLSAHDAALTEVQTASTSWSEAVAASDAARTAYDEALAALNEALAAEATARTSYETAQQTYADAYQAVPKEDSLAP